MSQRGHWQGGQPSALRMWPADVLPVVLHQVRDAARSTQTLPPPALAAPTHALPPCESMAGVKQIFAGVVLALRGRALGARAELRGDQHARRAAEVAEAAHVLWANARRMGRREERRGLEAGGGWGGMAEGSGGFS